MSKASGLSVLVVLLGFQAVQAQYVNPYYNPYQRGGYLTGSANVISAQGTYTTQMEQARILREKAEQAKLDTKRQAFDEMRYEKANTPSFTEENEKTQMLRIRRALNKPYEAEITSGSVHNLLVPYLLKLSAQGIQEERRVKVDQASLPLLNVTAGSKGSLGPLKNLQELEWPIVLIGPMQKNISSMLTTAVAQAGKGKLDPKLYRELKGTVEELRADMRTKFQKDKIDGGEYLTAKRFLEPLESAIKSLSEPGAAKFMNGTYAAKGRTVQELVENMSAQGLSFAPATPGNEPAYFGLYNALVAYSNSAQTVAFQVRQPPPPTRQ